MSLAASFDLIGELLPLSSSPSGQEDLVGLVYDRMNEFVDGESNDECACAILNLISKARSSLYNPSNGNNDLLALSVECLLSFSLAESICRYWRLLLKLSAFASETVRAKFAKTMPSIINDKRLSGVFGANCYLTQNVLFEYFTADALFHPSGDLFVKLIVELLGDLLNDIHSSDDDDEEEVSLDRRLWPASEGYNNVFVSENESCDHYCARYGQHLLRALAKLLNGSPRESLTKTIETMREQCQRLIDIQSQAFERFLIRQRSTVRLNLLIEFLRVTTSLEGMNLNRLPQQWTRDNQERPPSVV
jgi:hypothetical protein